ncbi:GSCOCG00013663001-RA-CDS [Cotesia congregata]|nr:GSCOCG00013663001-RA-CDS [Cotesia congregata]
MRFNSPDEYIQYLAQGGRSENNIYSCVQLLTKALEKNPLSWVHEFGFNGLNQVLRILYEIFQNNKPYERIQYECIRCLIAFGNNTVGLKALIEHQEALMIVVLFLDPSKPGTMYEALKLLGVTCLISNDTHKKVLNAVTMNGKLRRHKRFLPVVQGLMNRQNKDLRAACLQFINSVVSSQCRSKRLLQSQNV